MQVRVRADVVEVCVPLALHVHGPRLRPTERVFVQELLQLVGAHPLGVHQIRIGPSRLIVGRLVAGQRLTLPAAVQVDVEEDRTTEDEQDGGGLHAGGIGWPGDSCDTLSGDTPANVRARWRMREWWL